MAESRINITWDDVNSPDVEARIERQEAIIRTHDHQMRQRELAIRSAGPRPLYGHTGGGLWYRPAVYMAVFGLLAGVLAWSVGEAFSLAVPNRYMEFDEIRLRYRAIEMELHAGRITVGEGDARVAAMLEAYSSNPYVPILTDRSLTADQKDQRIAARLREDAVANRVHRIIWFALVGTALACCLAMAEPLVGRNWRTAVIYGAVATVVAVVGAVLLSLVMNRIYHMVGGGTIGMSMKRQVVARAVVWGVFGMCLVLAPGLALRSPRKLLCGALGGAIGGFLGGMLFDPLDVLLEMSLVSRLVAFVAIGMVGGFATGLFENVVRSGWLRVTAGVIAGKQFIVYRNPTYIGSSPACEVYLFRDPDISEQHAAIHVQRNGYEIVNMNPAARTFVNGEPIAKSRLRHGDQVQIGSSAFVFQERTSRLASD